MLVKSYSYFVIVNHLLYLYLIAKRHRLLNCFHPEGHGYGCCCNGCYMIFMVSNHEDIYKKNIFFYHKWIYNITLPTIFIIKIYAIFSFPKTPSWNATQTNSNESTTPSRAQMYLLGFLIGYCIIKRLKYHGIPENFPPGPPCIPLLGSAPFIQVHFIKMLTFDYYDLANYNYQLID